MSDFFDNWTIQVRKGLLELCILNALSERERYGYELVKTLVAVPGLFITESTLYPLLSRLRVSGLLKTRLVESSSGPARKYYSLTAKGRKAAIQMAKHLDLVVEGLERAKGEPGRDLMEWTEPARAELETYLERVRSSMVGTEGDPEEVCEDLRRHVDEELQRQGEETVTRDVLKPILAAIGDVPSALPEREPEPDPLQPASLPPRPPMGPAAIGLTVFSILISSAALFWELTSGTCAELFFDPIPTPLHVALVLAVPLSQIVLLRFGLKSSVQSRWWLGIVSGLGIGVSAYFALIFLPVMPIAILGLVVGLGLLPLSPSFAFLASLRLHAALRNSDPTGERARIPTVWIGLAIGLLALPLAGVSRIGTTYAMGLATSEDPATSARGMALLRGIGNEALMLENCYTSETTFHDPISALLRVTDPIQPSEARKMYYRVTGSPFNAVPPPQEWRSEWRIDPAFAFTENDELGGTTVGSATNWLKLTSSRLDGKIEAEELTAYTEWTMVFRNDSGRQREARAELMLPPGGVVSRLTLWVNGEEREAAFAGRSKTRGAYQSVVRRRRDPVLVTTSGPDRVLMQCFPVPRNGGEMRVRVGITSPLSLSGEDRAAVVLPSFSERNFQIPSTTQHAVWIESTRAFETGYDGLLLEAPAGDLFAARGEVLDRELSQPGAALILQAENSVECWAEESSEKTAEEGDQVLVQRVTRAPAFVPSQVVVVVDGSAPMAAHADSLAAALQHVPFDVQISVLLASDLPEVLLQRTFGGTRGLMKLTKSLGAADFRGGSDLVPALVEGWDLCAAAERSVLLMVHGAQPVEISSIDPLRQRMERRADGPKVVSVSLDAGPNALVRALDGKSAFEVLPRTGSIEEDLKGLFATWESGERTVIERELVPRSAVSEFLPASRHVARLWAKDEVLKGSRELNGSARADVSTQAEKRSALLDLAVHYKLVTPLSGAVVLETEEQYKRSGLKPGDSDRIPSVPEPETVLLLLVSLAFLGLAWRRQVAA